MLCSSAITCLHLNHMVKKYFDLVMTWNSFSLFLPYPNSCWLGHGSGGECNKGIYSVTITSLHLTMCREILHSCHVVGPLYYVIFSSSFLLNLVGTSKEVED